ncbi:MAG: CsbD family protein [Methylophilaceae bacterium]
MNTQDIKQNWNELKTSIKNEWQDLTEEEINKMEGNWDKMVDTLALKYALTKMEAEDKLNAWKAKVTH